MRFTPDQEDCVWYWLTEALIHDAVLVVASKPNSKSVITLLNYQEFFVKVNTFMNKS